MFQKYKIKFVVLALLVILVIPKFGYSQTNEEMARSIMKIRADVESLYTRIDQNKDNYKARMKSYALQISDSEVQINREKISIKLALADLQEIRKKIDNTSSNTIDLRPLLKNAFILLEKIIKEGIPFKVEERLSSLERIRIDLEEKLITQERALALLWPSYDDNIRLTGETGLFKQNIDLYGNNLLATVAKIGTMMLYFSTPDNRVGYVKYDGSRYIYETVSGKDKKNEILKLFDTLNKQIRTGYFTLPNALIINKDRS